jgi:diguanylate cyclase (GGDEF)-like protein
VRKLDTLEALARLSAAGTADRVAALSQAASLVAAAVGSEDVRLIVGDGTNYQAYPPKEGEDFFGLSAAGMLSGNAELRRLVSQAVQDVGRDGFPHDIARADGRHKGDYVALALWRGDTYVGTVVARGPWTAAGARRAGQFLEAAGPALAIMLERVSDPDLLGRVHEQLSVLADVASVFGRAKDMRSVLLDVANAINSATGFFSNIDVLDSRGRIVMRSTAASRYTGTPLHAKWIEMTKAPDPIREMILKERQPVLLPDLQNDPRISEEAREFYRAASLTSAATFPLVLQDEVVGLLRVGNLKSTTFSAQTVALFQDLAAQAAVVVKGVQLWEELQRSRKVTERYAAKLRASMEIEHHLARIDHLCGIPNRRYLDEVIAAECARTAREATHLSLAICDLDDFKRINDTHGHDVGDEVLRQFAAIARSSCRASDMVGRLGGDEFLFVLTATDLSNAVNWADRFRDMLEDASLYARGGATIAVTVSLGVAAADRTSPASPRLLIRRCDRALYQAKASGKNTVKWDGEPLDEAV